MKKSRRSKGVDDSLQAHKDGSESLNFRLCHVCFHLNESQDEIGGCQDCHIPYFTQDVLKYMSLMKSGWDEDDTTEVDEKSLYESTYSGASGKILFGLQVVW